MYTPGYSPPCVAHCVFVSLYGSLYGSLYVYVRLYVSVSLCLSSVCLSHCMAHCMSVTLYVSTSPCALPSISLYGSLSLCMYARFSRTQIDMWVKPNANVSAPPAIDNQTGPGRQYGYAHVFRGYGDSTSRLTDSELQRSRPRLWATTPFSRLIVGL